MALILHVADLHGEPAAYEWLSTEANAHPWDAVVIAGDMLDLPEPNDSDLAPGRPHVAQIEIVRACLRELPPNLPVLVCSGNHDFSPAPDCTVRWVAELARGRPNTFADGARAVIDELSFEVVGCGHLPAAAADFYVCHAPPAGADTAVNPSDHDFGDGDLTRQLAIFGEGTVLCGHVHSPRRWYDLRPQFRSLNPGVAEPIVPPTHIPNHVVIDTSVGTAMLIAGQNPPGRRIIRL